MNYANSITGEIDFRLDEQLPRLAGVLKDYPKLKEVTLKVRPDSLPHVNDWDMFKGFFELCKKGVSVCFELLDYEMNGDESEDEVEEIEEQRKFAEEHVEVLAKDWAGKGASNVCSLFLKLRSYVGTFTDRCLGLGGVEHCPGNE